MSGLLWHWDWCPHCKGEGWYDVPTGGYISTSGDSVVSGTFTSRERCTCCDGCGRVKVPNGFHLTPNVTGIVVTSDRTETVNS